MRKHSRITLYAIAVVLCAAGILCGIIGDVWAGKPPLAQGVSPAGTQTGQTPVPANAYPVGKPGATALPGGVIRSDTRIFWVTRYSKCEHELVREEPPAESMVGKTCEQFAQNYPAYKMEILNGMLRMIKGFDQYCPDHYIIKSDDYGGIYVYRNMQGEDKLSAVMKMNFTTDAVPEDYRPLIKDGMAFGSVEEIEGLIEDAET